MKIKEHQQVWNLWTDSKEQLERYVFSRFKDKELSKDVAQEVLLKIHKSCCSDRDIKNINSWLFQIAHNTALDQLKKSQKSKTDVYSNPDNEQTIWSDLSIFLEPLINLLPEKYGIPLKMSDIKGKKQIEISNELGLGISATKSRIQRGRKMLQEKIRVCFHLEMNKNGIPISASLKDCCTPLQEIEK